jgi:hypothetical protein
LSSDTRTRPGAARSRATRLADAAQAALSVHGSTRGERPLVGVVRGFDSQSRLRARVLRAKLDARGLRSLDLTTLPAATGRASASPRLGAPQLLVDTTGRASSSRGPVSRLAVRLGVPLVALSTSADPAGADRTSGPRRETRLVLAVDAARDEADRQLLDVALDDLVLRPDSDDARLDVHLERRLAIEDVRGEVRVRSDLVHPLAVEQPGERSFTLGTGPSVTLRPRSGRYHLLLDGVPIADLAGPSSLTVTTTRLRVVLA